MGLQTVQTASSSRMTGKGGGVVEPEWEWHHCRSRWGHKLCVTISVTID
jgi:hypothetical protein